MTTTVNLPESLLKRIEHNAKREGLLFDESLANLLQVGLAARDSEVSLEYPVISIDPLTGLPVLECSPSLRDQEMTPERVAAILHKQDVESFFAAGRQ